MSTTADKNQPQKRPGEHSKVHPTPENSLATPTSNRLKNYQTLRRSRLRRLWFKTYIRFIKLRGEPREIALGFALGLFVAMSPTMGVQMAVAVLLAALFKWSKIAAAIGVWITNPLTAPFIYGLTYLIGAKILGLHSLRGLMGEPSLSTLIDAVKKAPELLVAMTLGGIILGIPLAIVGFYLAHGAVMKYRQSLREKVRRQKERIQLRKERLKEKVQLQKERIRLKREARKKKTNRYKKYDKNRKRR